MLEFLFALAALICGLAIVFDVNLGSLTPHLVGLGIVLLALAILIGPSVKYVNARRVP